MSTHFDPVEVNVICHEACAIAEIKRLRAEVAYLEKAESDARALRAGADAACEFVAAERDKLRAEAKDYFDNWQNVGEERDRLRAEVAKAKRALAIAQAVEDCASVAMTYDEILRRADELLKADA